MARLSSTKCGLLALLKGELKFYINCARMKRASKHVSLYIAWSACTWAGYLEKIKRSTDQYNPSLPKKKQLIKTNQVETSWHKNNRVKMNALHTLKLIGLTICNHNWLILFIFILYHLHFTMVAIKLMLKFRAELTTPPLSNPIF